MEGRPPTDILLPDKDLPPVDDLFAPLAEPLPFLAPVALTFSSCLTRSGPNEDLSFEEERLILFHEFFHRAKDKSSINDYVTSVSNKIGMKS